MKTKLSKWWSDVRDQATTWDYGDRLVWQCGALCEEDYNAMIARGEEPNGHTYDMPEWLVRQTRFENLVAVLSERIRYGVAGLWCRWFGHDFEVDESGSGPDNPRVDWYCKRCGIGGTGWW